MTVFAGALRRNSVLVAALLLSAIALCGCGGGGGDNNTPVVAPTLQSIEVNPTGVQAPAGTTTQFSATAIFSDGSHTDVTQQVTWASSNINVATISNTAPFQGLASAKAAGSTTIAAIMSGVTGSTGYTVSAALLTGISLTPASASVPAGIPEQFTATGSFSDGTSANLTSQVTWTSSNSSIATVSTAGLATPAGALGTTIITAARGNVFASSPLTFTAATLVSIGVTPTAPTIANGTVEAFTATGVFTDSTQRDITNSVTWSSATPAVAQISNAAGSKGQAAAFGVGSTSISAVLSGVSGSTTLTVSAGILVSIQVGSASTTLPVKFNLQFTATGIYSDNHTQDLTTQVTWGSSTAAATISNAAGSDGLATGVISAGTTITAQSGSVQGSKALTVTNATLSTLAVTPAAASIPNGSSLQYKAVGTFSDSTTLDLTKQVDWSSDNPAVVTISSQGLADTLTTGDNIHISASSGTGPTKVTGTTTLTVTAATVKSITVTPVNSTIGIGASEAFTAGATFTDNTVLDWTTMVTWSCVTQAPATGVVATISNGPVTQGQATAIAAGQCTVTAVDPAAIDPATSAPVKGTTTLTVSPAALQSITISPPDPPATGPGVVGSGYEQKFRATGHYQSPGPDQDLTATATWTSFNPSLLTIGNTAGTKGLATGLGIGSTTITAQVGQISGVRAVNVTNATLTSITIAPAGQTNLAGPNLSLQYEATGGFSDGSTSDLTNQVDWSSSNPAAATISNTAGSQGLASSQRVLVPASTTITAALTGKTDTASIAVTPVAYTIAVSPPNQTLTGPNRTQQYLASAVFTDASPPMDITGQVVWSLSGAGAAGAATINNQFGSQGFLTTQQVGASTAITVTATLPSSAAAPGTASLTVQP